MSKPPKIVATSTISIEQLKPGMYVKSFSNNKNITIKSEGYISSEETIAQLRKANITQLVILPEKEKQTINIEKAFAEITTTAPTKVKKAP